MSRVETLADYIERWLHADGKSALATAETPYLVETGSHQATEALSNLGRGEYRTGELDLDVVKARHLSMDKRHVFVLEKRRGGVFSDLISVGRTPNVDICLPRAGISKFHAHFSQSRPGQFVLTDKESRNGTFLRGDRIEPNVPVPVEDGMEVRFASYSFRFMLPSSFRHLVSGLADLRTS